MEINRACSRRFTWLYLPSRPIREIFRFRKCLIFSIPWGELMLAFQEAFHGREVTSLLVLRSSASDSGGMYFLTGSEDCSIRLTKCKWLYA